MEFRELKYFLAIAKEQSISKAANALFITQPNLSRQMHNLEQEIGQSLFIRGTKKITLTEAGELLKKRAEEIMELLQKTETDLSSKVENISGDIYIGCCESYTMKQVFEVAYEIMHDYPLIKFHFFSGDSLIVKEKLDNSLIDFAIFIEPFDVSSYEYIHLPRFDTWGVLMKNDCSMSSKEFITAKDLWDKPLILSNQSLNKGTISQWFSKDINELNIVATYNLLYNASILVETNIGYAVCIDHIINTTNSNLCFKPLYPVVHSYLDIAWKKYQVFSPCSKLFLEYLKKKFNN